MQSRQEDYLAFFLPQAVVLIDRAQCSRQEKASLPPLIDEILGLCDRSRKEGLLVLDELREEISDPLLRLGVGRVVDGWDLEVVVESLVLSVLAQGSQGLSLLRGLVTIRGVTMLSRGLNPDNTIKPLLLSFLGADADLWQTYQHSIKPPELPQPSRDHLVGLVAQVLTQSGREVESDLLTEWAGVVEDANIQRLLRETDVSTLAAALWNTDLPTMNKFLGNLSVRAGTEVLQAVVALGEAGRPVWRLAQTLLWETFQKIQSDERKT